MIEMENSYIKVLVLREYGSSSLLAYKICVLVNPNTYKMGDPTVVFLVVDGIGDYKFIFLF